MKKRDRVYIEIKKMALAILGVIFFATAYRWFIVPGGLYSGGFTGISQLIKLLIVSLLPMKNPNGVDLTGIIFWCLNVPLLLLSYRIIGRGFFIRTLLCVFIQSFLLAYIPAPENTIFENPLLNCIAGGVISGFGVGTTLRAGGSGGGSDVVGMYCAKLWPSFSVGKLNIAVNTLIYLVAAIRSDIDTAAYSLIFSIVASFMIDKTHTQNIKVSVFVISKNAQVGELLMKEMKRGVTSWNGIGEYTKQKVYISYIVVNKYELYYLRSFLRKLDEHAFTTIFSPQSVLGNFEKRLEVS